MEPMYLMHFKDVVVEAAARSSTEINEAQIDQILKAVDEKMPQLLQQQSKPTLDAQRDIIQKIHRQLTSKNGFILFSQLFDQVQNGPDGNFDNLIDALCNHLTMVFRDMKAVANEEFPFPMVTSMPQQTGGTRRHRRRRGRGRHRKLTSIGSGKVEDVGSTNSGMTTTTVSAAKIRGNAAASTIVEIHA